MMLFLQAMQKVEVYSSATNSCRLSLPSLHGLFTDHSLDYVDGNVLLCGGSTYCQLIKKKPYSQLDLSLPASQCSILQTDLTWAPLGANLTTKRTSQASAAYRLAPGS